MAHWAELDENNIVKQVLVTENNADEGYSFLMFAFGGRWVKTSYNTKGGIHMTGGTPFRKNYAGIGFTYDEQRDAFIPPKPSDNAILNEETCLWEVSTEE
jgi:hypothetical protein